MKISNTRLPKLYFADAANLLLQYNLKRIEPLSPRGMSGQDEQGTMEFRGEEETYPELAEEATIYEACPAITFVMADGVGRGI